MKTINSIIYRTILVSAFLAMVLMIMPLQPVSASQENYLHWSDFPLGGEAWQNGALQSTNSQYGEGEVVPHYFTTSGMTIGNLYAFNIVYDYYNVTATTCGFLYLTAYNVSRSPSFVNLTPAPTAGALEGGGVIYAAGASTVSVSAPAIFSTNQRYVTVTYTASAATAEFYWGLYLSMDGEITGCGGARDWPGASLQTHVDATPVVAGYTMIGGGGTMAINPSAVIPSNIGGTKFYDLNGINGQEAGEPPLAGWTIDVYLCTLPDCSTKSFVTSDITDANGNYTFTGLIIGNVYQACEVLQTGWEQTYPVTNGGCSPPVTITEGVITTIQDFGNRQVDWGDLPDSAAAAQFPTLKVNNGARHVLYPDSSDADSLPNSLGTTSAIWLGSYIIDKTNIPWAIVSGVGAIDSEVDGQPTLNADGDDVNPAAGIDDEDGVLLTSWLITPSMTMLVRCTSSEALATGWIVIWFDWNHNLQFDGTEPSTPLFNQAVNCSSAGTENILTSTDARLAGKAAIYYRARLFAAQPTDVSTAYLGGVTNGEVEDYYFDNATAATVAAPSAVALDYSIQVDWQTFDETHIMGFDLYRSTDPSGAGRSKIYYTDANNFPSDYSFVDTDVQPGVAYYYWLVALETSGPRELGPATALVTHKVFLPTIVR